MIRLILGALEEIRVPTRTTSPDRENNQITLDIAKVAKLIGPQTKKAGFYRWEPLLQANKLVELIKNLPKIDIEIETNGTIEPPSNLEKKSFNLMLVPN